MDVFRWRFSPSRIMGYDPNLTSITVLDAFWPNRPRTSTAKRWAIFQICRPHRKIWKKTWQMRSVYIRPYSFVMVKSAYRYPPWKPIALVCGPIIWKLSQYYVTRNAKYDLIDKKVQRRMYSENEGYGESDRYTSVLSLIRMRIPVLGRVNIYIRERQTYIDLSTFHPRWDSLHLNPN